MRFKAVLLDIDDTLFNFRQSSFEAMQGALARRGVRFTWDDMAEYETYNNALWKQLERGEITRAFLFPERFRRYFAARGLPCHLRCFSSSAEFNTAYLSGLAQGYAFMPHCRELLEALHGKYKVFIVTNGDAFAQRSRIERSGLAHLFDGVFISEVVGAEKPSRAFFDAVLSAIGPVDKEELLLIGDSLTSDMAGGCGAGIPCCWYDPKGLPVPEDLPIRHTIRNLNEIPSILAAHR